MSDVVASRHGKTPAGLERHAAFNRVFQPGRLTFGFMAPLEGYPSAPWPTLKDQLAMVRKADELGFAAIWLRDVPFLDLGFGDLGQIMDPMVYGGWLAAQTSTIAIGTAGIALPLRDPISVAKQSSSIDQISLGRFLLGLSTGDRPSEYPAFGRNFHDRGERFRDALPMIRTATESSFGVCKTKHYGALDGSIDLLPKPFDMRLPFISVGRCGQTIDWLADNMDGWISHRVDFSELPIVIRHWRTATERSPFKPYGYGMFFDLDENPEAPSK